MNVSVKQRILLPEASDPLGRNFLDSVGNDPSIQILFLPRKECQIFEK